MAQFFMCISLFVSQHLDFVQRNSRKLEAQRFRTAHSNAENIFHHIHILMVGEPESYGPRLSFANEGIGQGRSTLALRASERFVHRELNERLLSLSLSLLKWQRRQPPQRRTTWWTPFRRTRERSLWLGRGSMATSPQVFDQLQTLQAQAEALGTFTHHRMKTWRHEERGSGREL